MHKVYKRFSAVLGFAYWPRELVFYNTQSPRPPKSWQQKSVSHLSELIQNDVPLDHGNGECPAVNLSHLACEFPTDSKVESTYRHLQRFFQHVDLGSDWAAPLLVKMIGSGPNWHLCLDRKNWKISQRHVNFLVKALVTCRHRIPLMWSVLGRAGNSDTAQHIALMERYLSVFDVSTIKFLLADREFIGAQWLDFLHKNNVPFVICIKAN
jgi:hypothetical protein